MVYESDFYTTRRAYSRPTVSSYSVSYPIYNSPVPRRVYTASYPIYSYHSIPYIAHKRLVTGTRVVTSPYRVITSPIRTIRSVRSPVRTVVRTTRVYSPIRDIVSPVRVISTPTYTTPISTYVSHRTLPSVLNRVYDRIENKYRSKPAYRPLEDYLNSSSYINFDDETRRIRTSAATLMREIHTPAYRRARSVTPFPVSRPESASSMVLENYIARVTNPLRHIALDTSYPLDPLTRKYIGGKSHLASVKIVGNKAYGIRNPLYDPDRIRTDVEYLSYYLRNRRAATEKLPDKIVLESAKLDPFRPTRKFTNPKPLEDPNLEIKEKQAARYEKLMAQKTDDDIELEKKKARRLADTKRIEEMALEEEKKKKEHAAEEVRAAEIARQEKLAQEAAAERAAEMERIARENEELRLIEEARLAEEARIEDEARLIEEARLAEEARIAEEERLAKEARRAEKARKAEEARLAEEARRAEEARLEEEARAAEEARLAAEEARIEEEQRHRDEELARLAELEQIAGEEREAELARQAAELAEIARQESEIAAQELEAIQKTDSSKDINANLKSEEVTEDEESNPIVDEPQTPIDDERNPILSPEPNATASDYTETESEAE